MTDQLTADGVEDAPRDHANDAIDPSGPPDSTSDDHDAPPTSRQRVNRWDRPPQPRDWRFYVGGIGKVLIATGLLIFGFVAYQLWGTGIETARAQNQLENQFEELLVEFGGADASDPANASTGAAPSSDTNASTDDAVAAPSNDPAVRPPADAGSPDDAAGDPELTLDVDAGTQAIPVAVDLSEQAVIQDPIPQPFRGDPLLRLEIPEIGRDDIVVPGVSLSDLKDGPGHYPDTPLPGQLGNAAIAGHRTTYGAPFYDVDQLSAGDEIITTLLNGDRFVYEVTTVEVVSATDYWVVATTDPNIAELTLTSCHPKYTARDRIVVHSVLSPAKSSNVGVPTFYSLEAPADDAPIPGDDPVLEAAEDRIEVVDPAGDATDADATAGGAETNTDADPSESATDQSATDQAATEPDSNESGAAPREATTSATPVDGPTPVDAFAEGWFHDAGAFPQLALWVLVLATISVLAYQMAKRFRRVWVGVALGVVPFLVALYFFYQNVNRLLPAGI